MISAQIENLKMVLENLDLFTAGIVLIIAKIVGAVLLIPGTPLTLLSGAILGKFWGTIVAIIGNTIGAICAFLVARYLLRDLVQNKILKKYPKINDYENKLFKDGFYTVIFMRLVPLFPFNILNVVLGITQVKFKDYALATFIGIIPGTFLFVYLGESFRMLSPLNITLAVIAIFGLSNIGKIWKINK